MSHAEKTRPWALILGASSGFGLAAAKRLARDGFGIVAVHRDRRARMAAIEAEFGSITATGVPLIALNLDALSEEGREEVLRVCQERVGRGNLRLLLHSIAWGNLKPLVGEAGECLSDEDFERTVFSMGTSLVTWTRELFQAGLFSPKAGVVGLTSEGNAVAWQGYAAVSAAKAALEASARSIAVEFGRYGIRCNIIQPGVTETPAFRAIPGAGKMAARALERNPGGRLTLPEDVAPVVAFLASDDSAWVNGALIRVDGGECVSGL
jgi:enoyl-[acyl-carrier protein] reductase III